MSAVEDVAARVQRLQEALALKRAQLQRAHLTLRYNAALGVDEDIHSGASAAALELRVFGARGVAFGSGFLSGKAAYVRVSLVTEAGHGQPQYKSTHKLPIDQPLRWQEAMVFNEVASASGLLRVEVVQEERIGADASVGAVTLPLMGLYDQRPMEKWHALSRPTDGAPNGDMHMSCRFHRSQISAMELEVELLQNQVKELAEFMSRHPHSRASHYQQPLISARSSTASAFFPAKPLEGKEVVVATASTDMRRTSSTRFSKVESFHHGQPGFATKRDVTIMDSSGTDINASRSKRQRMDSETSRPSNASSSISDKLANWLLPSSFASSAAAKGDANATEASGERSSTFFPFKQRVVSPEGRRPPKRSHRPSALPKAPLQAIEQWFFSDRDNNPRSSPLPNKAPFS